MKFKNLREIYTNKFWWNLWLILAWQLGNSVKILNEFYVNSGRISGKSLWRKFEDILSKF